MLKNQLEFRGELRAISFGRLVRPKQSSVAPVVTLVLFQNRPYPAKFTVVYIYFPVIPATYSDMLEIELY